MIELSPLEAAIVVAVRAADRRLPRPSIRAALARAGRPVSNSHLGEILSGLVAAGVLINDHDKRGYGVSASVVS